MCCCALAWKRVNTEQRAAPFRNALLFKSMAPDSGVMLANFMALLQQRLMNHAVCNVEDVKARIKALPRDDREGKLTLWKELIVASAYGVRWAGALLDNTDRIHLIPVLLQA